MRLFWHYYSSATLVVLVVHRTLEMAAAVPDTPEKFSKTQHHLSLAYVFPLKRL